MSQIASKQIVFLIIILRIVHAYIVYQLLLIFVKLPPPTLSANVRPQAAIMGSSYDQWSMMMIKLLCTCLTLAGYCLHKNAVCTNLPGYVCKREPKNINNGKYSYISITVNSWYIFLSYLSSHHIILEIRYHLKLMQRQHLASLANRYERYRMKIYKTFFFFWPSFTSAVSSCSKQWKCI